MTELPLNDSRLFLGALDVQIGGTHYKGRGIEPIHFAEMNDLPACLFNALKYIVRYRLRNGREDIQKAMDYVAKAAHYYQTNGNPFKPDKVWKITPEEFIKSYPLEGQERDAVRCICDVQNNGLSSLILAHRCLQVVLDNTEPVSSEWTEAEEGFLLACLKVHSSLAEAHKTFVRLSASENVRTFDAFKKRAGMVRARQKAMEPAHGPRA